MAETDRAPGRWLRIALVVSLAVNLGVAGLMAGAAFTHSPWSTREGAHRADRARGARPAQELRELGPLPFIVALSSEDREALLQAARGSSDALQTSREALRARFEEMLRLLRRDPFDGAAMAALLAEQRAAGNARQELGETLLVAQFEAMGPEARAAYADRLDRSLRRGPPRR